jgi:hypothetical protein
MEPALPMSCKIEGKDKSKKKKSFTMAYACERQVPFNQVTT